MGLYFEDFAVGDIHQTRGRTVTEADIVNFAGLTGDYTELHTNAEYARQTPAGQRIAHGALVFSISIGLTTQTNMVADTVIAFYGLDKLRFTRPVLIGDTVHVAKKVVDLAEKGDRGIVTFETSVLNQRDELVILYVDKLMVQRRGR